MARERACIRILCLCGVFGLRVASSGGSLTGLMEKRGRAYTEEETSVIVRNVLKGRSGAAAARACARGCFACVVHSTLSSHNNSARVHARLAALSSRH